jgi:hypothetical protein
MPNTQHAIQVCVVLAGVMQRRLTFLRASATIISGSNEGLAERLSQVVAANVPHPDLSEGFLVAVMGAARPVLDGGDRTWRLRHPALSFAKRVFQDTPL